MDTAPHKMDHDASGAARAPEDVVVWDLAIRLFHWGLATAVLTAYFSAGNYPTVHECAGYVALALLLFRIWWGVAGSQFARFSDFVKSPAAVVAYLLRMFTGQSERHLGHNPAGGQMIVLMLLFIAALCATGWLQLTATYFGDPKLEMIHHWLGNGLIALVPLHVLGVIVSSAMHRENLVGAMLSGRKRLDDETRHLVKDAGPNAEILGRLRSSEALAVMALLVAGGFGLGLYAKDRNKEVLSDSPAQAVSASAAADATVVASAQSSRIAVTPAKAAPVDPKEKRTIVDTQDFMTGGPEAPSLSWMLSSGGRLYDKWYQALGRPAPATTHHAWPRENTSFSGADTWRCSLCHGWDYKGRDGENGSGPKTTGIRGLARARGKRVDEIVAILEGPVHRFSDDIIPSHAKYRLALFVSQGTHQVDEYVLRDDRIKGDASKGKNVYQSTCAACHGFDGRARRLGASAADPSVPGLFVGTKARSGPREVMHKIRNGHPGAIMVSLRAFPEQVAADVLAYVRTLPEN